MKEFSELESLWKQQARPAVPPAAEMLSLVRKNIAAGAKQNKFILIALTITWLLLAFWGFFTPHQSNLALAGLILSAGSLLLVMARFIYTHIKFKAINYTQPVPQVLAGFKTYRRAQLANYTFWFWLFVVPFATGILLIIPDVFSPGSPAAVITAILWAAWVIFSSTYIYRHYLKTQQRALNQSLNQLSALQTRLQNN